MLILSSSLAAYRKYVISRTAMNYMLTAYCPCLPADST
jgi:hypothetical protein